jgi:hypothetical protein
MTKTIYSAPVLVDRGSLVTETLGRTHGSPNDGMPLLKN